MGVKTKEPAKPRGAAAFIAQHADKVTGVLHGYDRLLLAGTLRPLHYNPMGYLSRVGVLLKDFKAYAAGWKDRICAAAKALAEREGRPQIYLRDSSLRKDRLAHERAERDGVENGLIGVWRAVERCQTWNISGNRKARKLVLSVGPGKCLHYYFYFMHEQLGLMHLRLQTWFPFAITVCVNGRHWLARMMDKAGLGYLKQDNCFTELEDVQRAQELADEQVKANWAGLLDPMVEACHPHAKEICRALGGMGYYWSMRESEYATDVMFRKPGDLAELYPFLIHHGIRHFNSADVLRFAGAKVLPDDRMPTNLQAEVTSSFKRRPEGVRIKHRHGGNSVKLYDKQARVLRAETTINEPKRLKTHRAAEGNPKGPRKLRPLRRSVADGKRRAEISRKTNERYLEALAAITAKDTAGELAGRICQPVVKKGRRHRALNPWGREDARTLELINDGRWLLEGFRNCDVRQALYAAPKNKREQQRQSARVSRTLARLRAHGLIRKMSRSYRYQVTKKGRGVITALLAARQTDAEKLFALAA